MQSPFSYHISKVYLDLVDLVNLGNFGDLVRLYYLFVSRYIVRNKSARQVDHDIMIVF